MSLCEIEHQNICLVLTPKLYHTGVVNSKVQYCFVFFYVNFKDLNVNFEVFRFAI